MRKIFLHVGQPKTGTSSIQLFLKLNRNKLLDLGYLVPETGQGRETGNHHDLFRCLADRPQKSRSYVSEENFIAEIRSSEANYAIMSSEALSAELSNPADLGKIIEKLRPIAERIVLVLYVRNQPQWINSLYSQEVKSFRHNGDFDVFANRILERTQGRAAARWLVRARRHDVDLLVRPFNMAVRQVGAVQDFLTSLEINFPDKEAAKLRVNESVGPIVVEAARRLMDSISKDLSALSHRQVVQSKLALARTAEELRISEPSYCGLTTAEARIVEAAFAKANQELATRAWGTTWDEMFSEDINLDYNTNDLRRNGGSSEIRVQLDELTSSASRKIFDILSNPRFA